MFFILMPVVSGSFFIKALTFSRWNGRKNMKVWRTELVVAILALVPAGADSAFAQSTAGIATAPMSKSSAARVAQQQKRGIPSARDDGFPLPRVADTTEVNVSEDRSGAGDWLFPGEYESHQAMWVFWPTLENKVGFPSTEPIRDMIQAMSGHVHVNLAVQDADDEAAARSFLIATGVPLSHVHFFHLEPADIWARDFGPQFTRSSAGKLRINDWNFNMCENPQQQSTFSEPLDRTAASVIMSVPPRARDRSRRSNDPRG
jgi:hypothetical protein